MALMLPRKKNTPHVEIKVHAVATENVETRSFQATDFVQLTSSNLARAEYDDYLKLLRITFTSGRAYEYRAVPRPVFDTLKSAPSPGMYFAVSIKKVYRYIKL
jgi:hypothetical protein